MSGSYPGIYRGVCFDINDPEGRLRIRVKIPQLLGDAPTGWAWPCLPAGWRDNLVKPHADHEIAGHSHTTSASGSGSGGDSAGDSVSVSVTTTGTTNVAGASTQTHTNNHVLQQKTPKIGEGVWVMFEGGSIDYPIWIGTF